MTIKVNLHRLKNKSNSPAGVTWGVPWEKGKLERDKKFILKNASGKELAVQSWPTAYWPDGTVKWTAHAASFAEKLENKYILETKKLQTNTSQINALHFDILNEETMTNTLSTNTISKENRRKGVLDNELKVVEKDDTIKVNTGKIICILNKTGSSIIRSIYREDKKVCSEGRLICIREKRSKTTGQLTLTEELFRSIILNVSIEQKGPVRCVIKVKGRHKSASGSRKWLPFTLRFYFYINQKYLKIVHTFFYDGNPDRDFIKGLGITFKIPMHGSLYNRHLRFGGDDGFFSESPKLLMTRKTKGKYQELYKRQVAGEYISFDEDEDSKFLNLLDDAAVWNDFKLVQNSPDYYTVKKRTKENCSWIKSCDGNRSQGLVYAGSEKGGFAVALKNFWQKYPTSLEVNNMAEEEAELKVWFWSPDFQAMDLRHYDTETHLESAYEGFEEMRSTPYGIANTSELNLWCFSETPSQSFLLNIAQECQTPSLLVCQPEYYHNVNAFGCWSLPDKSTPVKKYIEEQLEAAVYFYQDEVEQRRWYGFWDYGDFRHSYDPIRHSWRYDIGGYAWQNTELVPNMWLWYSFLRTGQEDIFRLAEAMTRHTSEVDIYHFGEYAGLGSRHNVIHWGCGCKEVRISMAGLHRFYYYLTGDERIGEIMSEVKDSNYSVGNLDPMRAYFPKNQYPTHVRSGPDWMAFSSNWFTEWERTEDIDYRDKLFKGIEFFKNLPHGLLHGSIFGYDPNTNELFYMGDQGGTHFMFCFGNSQVWVEIAGTIDDPEWEELLMNLAEYYSLNKGEKISEGELPDQGFGWSYYPTALAAYTAYKRDNKDLARKVWEKLILNKEECRLELPFDDEKNDDLSYPKGVRELPWISTNVISQWSLNVIMSLEFISDQLPEVFHD